MHASAPRVMMRVWLEPAPASHKGDVHGFDSAGRSDQIDPRLGGDGSQRAAGAAGHRSVRQPRVQRRSAADAPSETDLPRAPANHDARRAARHLGRRRGGVGDEGVGGRARRDALHALVPAAHRHHRREARFVSLADRRRQGGRRIRGQGTGARRARRIELPVRRHALHLRGARLHGVGSDQPAVAAQERQFDDAGDSDGVRQLDGRGAGQEDAASPLDGSAVEAGGPHPEDVRLDRRARHHDLRARAGVLPDRSLLLSVAARSHQRRADALRREAAEGAGARRSVLRLDPRPRDGVHVRRRERALQGRRPGEDAP